MRLYLLAWPQRLTEKDSARIRHLNGLQVVDELALQGAWDQGLFGQTLSDLPGGWALDSPRRCG